MCRRSGGTGTSAPLARTRVEAHGRGPSTSPGRAPGSHETTRRWRPEARGRPARERPRSTRRGVPWWPGPGADARGKIARAPGRPRRERRRHVLDEDAGRSGSTRTTGMGLVVDRQAEPLGREERHVHLEEPFRDLRGEPELMDRVGPPEGSSAGAAFRTLRTTVAAAIGGSPRAATALRPPGFPRSGRRSRRRRPAPGHRAAVRGAPERAGTPESVGRR